MCRVERKERKKDRRKPKKPQTSSAPFVILKFSFRRVIQIQCVSTNLTISEIESGKKDFN